MKYKIGKISSIKAPKEFRCIGVSYNWEWYPHTLNIFLYKRQIKIPFVLNEKTQGE